MFPLSNIVRTLHWRKMKNWKWIVVDVDKVFMNVQLSVWEVVHGILNALNVALAVDLFMTRSLASSVIPKYIAGKITSSKFMFIIIHIIIRNKNTIFPY